MDRVPNEALLAVDTERPIDCPQCGTSVRPGDPFCPKCGRLSSHVGREGPLAVEIQEIPSETIRTLFVETLRQWFPELDRFRADDRVRKGPSVLIAGIDEEFAQRLVAALKVMNVDGRLRPDVPESGIGLLWNPGLAVSAGLLFLSYLLGGFLGLLFLLGAFGAPVVGAGARRRRNIPLVPLRNLVPDSERWIRLSIKYSGVMKNLASEDAIPLRSLTEAVFDLQKRLRSRSLASIAAGGEGGSLYKRLGEAIERAVDLSAGIAGSEGQGAENAKQELAALAGLVKSTADWYNALETGEIKQTPQLTQELQDITAGIERIVEEVRFPLEPGHVAGKKERL